MIHQRLIPVVFLFCLGLIWPAQLSAAPRLLNNTTYYVSTSGNDSNNGLSEAAPFRTIGHVNSLNLGPGDRVLFKCGDVWRAESLIVIDSGVSGNPLTFGSYPANCVNKPVISGAQPIGGWSPFSGSIYVADLSAGANAGKFPEGINQLFQGSGRLPMGRWPNINAADGGYSTVDGQSGSTITDNELPAANWTGAMIHLKVIRWSMVNRRVTASSGPNLTLNLSPGCWGGDCQGWGYFINNHLATLDQNGEWFYDEGTNRVYLVSTGGAPTNIEGSVIIPDADEGFYGGIILGRHLNEAIHYVTIDNLEVSRWFDNGITTPRNLEVEDNSNVTIRRVNIRDADNAGIFFTTWIWNAGPNSGWRGGRNILVEQTLIERANHIGINTYTVNSTFRDMTLRDIALIENLGKDGLGCPIDQGEGYCTRDGVGIRIPIDNPAFSGFGNTLRYNRLEKIGHSGIDLSGADNLIEYNYIEEAAFAKGDNGAIAIFGGSGFANTNATGNTIRNNIIIDPIGNTDGNDSFFDPLFAAGIYLDHYSTDTLVEGNTVMGATLDGILVQNSRATINNNIVYDNSSGTMNRGQMGLYNDSLVSLHGNVFYGLKVIDNSNFAKTMHTEGATAANITAADNNYYFNPYKANHISINFAFQTLAQWQSASGLDTNSTTNWFSLNQGDPPRSQVFYNDTKSTVQVNLGNTAYLDLDQNSVVGSLTLAPFTAEVLIDNSPVSLTITSLNPTLWGADEAADFSLTVNGAGFSPSSIVRWNGADRATTFINSAQLQATILSTDVNTVNTASVTVYDPTSTPDTSNALNFQVVEAVTRIYLPAIFK